MKLNQLTFTRFIAAFVVIIFHFATKSFPFNNYFLNQIFIKGYLAVGYFFVLSGFVMFVAYSAKQKEIEKREYYFARFTRIYPIYFVALIAVAAFQLITHGFEWKPFLLNATLLQAWVPGYTFTCNPAAWSLSVEFLFYLLFPILYNCFYIKFESLRWTLGILLILMVLQLGMDYFLFNPKHGPVSEYLIHSPFVKLNQFLIGNFIGILFKYIKRKNYDALIFANTAIILGILFVDLPQYLENSLTTFFFAAFILLLALNTGKITRLFSRGIFVKAGEFSYSIYIVQYPSYFFLGFLTKHIVPQLNAPFPIITFVLIAGVCGFYIVELRFNTILKKARTTKLAMRNAELLNGH